MATSRRGRTPAPSCICASCPRWKRSWPGKEPDRTDTCIRWNVLSKALDDLAGCAPAIELQEDVFEIGHALLRCHGNDLLGAERLAHTKGNPHAGRHPGRRIRSLRI